MRRRSASAVTRTRSRSRAAAGPVRLLANLRYLGHVFNPVSLYHCFGESGERVEAVVADVNNIPWGSVIPMSWRADRAAGPC